MAARTVRLLHVEDDEIQRRLLRAQLGGLKQFNFTIDSAESEDEALTKFAHGFDFVILDYHLTEGNGLSCLKRIRHHDAVVPIIAISGVATPEIAADLLEAGADDYFSKEDLQPAKLGQSVQNAIARADAWKARAPEMDAGAHAELDTLFQDLCRSFAQNAGDDFLSKLDKFEKTARGAKVSFAQAVKLFEQACEKVDSDGGASKAQLLLRPVMLEIVLRLFEEVPGQ